MERIKIMMVDDNTSFLNSLALYFKHLTFLDIKATASSAKEAWALLKTLEVDLLLLDIKMESPKAGLLLAEQMKASLIPCPNIVFLTAEYSELDMKRARAMNCSFIDKSYTLSELVTYVKRIYFDHEILIKSKQSMAPIKVFILEDMRSFVDGFGMYLNRVPNFKFMGSAATGQECFRKIKNKPIDVLVIDIKLGKDSWGGIKVAEQLMTKAEQGEINHLPAIAFLTAFNEAAYIQKAEELNCSLLDKYDEMPQIVKALEGLHRKKKPTQVVLRDFDGQPSEAKSIEDKLRTSLTARQGQTGLNTTVHLDKDKVAKIMDIKPSVVSTHLKNAYINLELNNQPHCRERLMDMFRKSGLTNHIDAINKAPHRWFARKKI